jgi:hypothetical protein
VSSLSPSRHQPGESFLQLEARLSALKTVSNCCQDLFPGYFSFPLEKDYDRFLSHDLQPDLYNKLREKLEVKKKELLNKHEVDSLRARLENRPIPELNSDFSISTTETAEICRQIEQEEEENLNNMLRNQNRLLGLPYQPVISSSSLHIASLPPVVQLIMGVTQSAAPTHLQYSSTKPPNQISSSTQLERALQSATEADKKKEESITAAANEELKANKEKEQLKQIIESQNKLLQEHQQINNDLKTQIQKRRSPSPAVTNPSATTNNHVLNQLNQTTNLLHQLQQQQQHQQQLQQQQMQQFQQQFFQLHNQQT